MKGLVQIALAVIGWTLAIPFTLGFALLPLALWAVLVFNGAPARAAKAVKTLRSTLMQDEELIEHAVQHRAFALFQRREVVAITNSRIVVVRRGLLGGFTMADIQWKDLLDVTIEQNVLEQICGSNLRFRHLNTVTPQIAVDGVPSGVASKVYSKAQFEEQAWEEKRRIRGIEEVRAAAGGVVVNNAPMAEPAKPSSGASNRMLEEIKKAKELLDLGAVSDAEFQEMKAKILAGA